MGCIWTMRKCTIWLKSSTLGVPRADIFSSESPAKEEHRETCREQTIRHFIENIQNICKYLMQRRICDAYRLIKYRFIRKARIRPINIASCIRKLRANER